MSRIGIFGGTFNPIHNAHIRVAEEALQRFSLDKIWFMPAGAPPHKQKEKLVSGEHRCNMIKAAIKDYANFELCDYEVKKDTLSYTAITMSELNSLYPQDKFYFIIGGDSLLKFEHWREPEKIVRLTKILACGRAGNKNLEVQNKITELNRKWNCDIRYFEVPMMDISSRDIRVALQSEASTKEMLPKEVYEYIRRENIYQKQERAVNHEVTG